MRTIWLTGLPCSGKTTIALELKRKYFKDYVLLDGDTIRNFIHNNDMSMEGRKLHLSYISYMCRLLNDQNCGVICSFVSPTNDIRETIDGIVGNEKIMNVWVKCSKQECIKRDVKGMWKKAIDGQIKNFTGWDGEWDDPNNSDIVIETDKNDLETCCEKIWEYLR